MFNFLGGSSLNRAARRVNRRRAAALGVEVLETRTVMDASGVDLETPDGEYSIQAKKAAALPDPGQTIKTARNLGTLKTTAGAIDVVQDGDEDWFKFTVTKLSGVTVTLTGLTEDADLHLLDSKGNAFAMSESGGASDETLTVNLAKGTYYVRVFSFSGLSTGYNLKLQNDVDTAGDTIKKATNLGKLGTSTIVATGAVGGYDAHDVYKFTVTKQGTVPISLTGLSGDANLRLFNQQGLLIRESTSFGNFDELIATTLGKGTFYVDVVSDLGSSARYMLSIGLNQTEPEPPVIDPLPNGPDLPGISNWNINLVNAPDAWQAGYTGQGVLVAVIDTGIDVDHPDLDQNVWVNTKEVAGDGVDNDGNGFIDDIYGWDFINGDGLPDDDQGHGTHVAGTIAAERNVFGVTGVAYNAQVMAVKVLASDGFSRGNSVANGIRYAVDNGAKIINLSLGSGGLSTAMEQAIAYAAANNVFVVAASGNENAFVPSYPARLSSTYNNVISVGAFDIQLNRADFSNRVGGSGAVQIDGPGVAIQSTLPGGNYGANSGTSMATPHVAAVAALMLSANPALTAPELRTLLARTANLVVTGSDSLGGVNANLAVAAALNPGAVLAGASAAQLMYLAGFGAAPTTTSSASIFSVASADVESPIVAGVPALLADAVAAASIGRDSAFTGLFADAADEFSARRVEIDSIAADAAGAIAKVAEEELFADPNKLESVFASLAEAA